MKYLNLTDGFNPFNKSGDDLIDFKFFTFSGGEPHIKLTHEKFHFTDVTISIRIESFNDMGKLMIAVDALRKSLIRWSGTFRMKLFLPYFPGARQDRVMVHGEALTSSVYAKLINDMKFTNVTIYDPHSDVAPALINNCIMIDNHEFVRKALMDIYPQRYATNPLLISPDAGSNKKVTKLGQYLSTFNRLKIVNCNKVRDINTGALTGFEVYVDDLEGKDCIIVDDICDGGGTFIGLAKELILKNAGNIYLIVSHGIFSKGIIPFSMYISKIYTTDSRSEPIELSEEASSTELKVMKLKDLI